jgi:hypothetical protein
MIHAEITARDAELVQSKIEPSQEEMNAEAVLDAMESSFKWDLSSNSTIPSRAGL